MLFRFTMTRQKFRRIFKEKFWLKTEGGGLGGYEMEGDPMRRHRYAGGQGVVEIGIRWTLVEDIRIERT